MTPFLAIAVVVILFVAFGLLNPKAGCDGGCKGCDHSCNTIKDDYHE